MGERRQNGRISGDFGIYEMGSTRFEFCQFALTHLGQQGRMFSERECEMQTKLIVVLANSVKSSGRCLAGKEVSDNGKTWHIGGWIRPVTTKAGGEISAYQMSLALGHDPKLLEVIEIPFSKAVPLPYQPENWLIEMPLKQGAWKSHGMIEWDDAPSLLDQKPEMWHDPTDDDRRVREGFPERMKVPASLYFIKPDNINSVS